MSKTTTPKPADKKAEELKDTSNKKVCFVVMPISDQEGYEKDHFDRVYNHLIVPAIKKAGLEPKRADEEQVTNDIRLDIIKKILESDHVICDLSAKNPNVFYELGMRQAFDKSITLIKDYKTPKVFDVAGIRTIYYDENLRIDNIEPKITEISNSIEKTLEHTETYPYENSIIRQLGITAAQPAEKTEISPDTQLILEQIKYLSNRINSYETKNNSISNNFKKPNLSNELKINYNDPSIEFVRINNRKFPINFKLYKDNKSLGRIMSFSNNEDFIIQKEDKQFISIPYDDIAEDSTYRALPF